MQVKTVNICLPFNNKMKPINEANSIQKDDSISVQPPFKGQIIFSLPKKKKFIRYFFYMKENHYQQVDWLNSVLNFFLLKW
jgi:hypothetical protein